MTKTRFGHPFFLSNPRRLIDTLNQDTRDIKEQMASVRIYDRTNDCPTYAAIILFGKNPRYYMPGAYVQYVRFAGKEN